MLKDIVKKEPTALDDEIERVHTAMQDEDLASGEYDKLLAVFERLNRLKNEIGIRRVSPDTWAAIGGNLLGILLIVNYERTHVLVSRATGFIKTHPTA